MSFDLDLLVVGSGPAGQKAAVQGAKLGKRVAVVERRHMVGGVCVNTGTIPSKTLREAVVYLTGMSQREIYGSSYRVKAQITMSDLRQRTERVIEREIDVIRDQLLRNQIELINGTARFLDAHTPLRRPRLGRRPHRERRRGSCSPSGRGRPTLRTSSSTKRP